MNATRHMRWFGLALLAMPVVALPQQTDVDSEAATAPQCRALQVEERMQRMQSIQDSLAKATTPEQRQQLLDQQMTLMRESMQAMHGPGMGGRRGMRGGPMMGGTAMTGPVCVEERMAMMQMMMQAMMERLAASDDDGGAR